MKLDDRDIIGEQDYTPLSNAELVAHIELYARLIHNTPLNDGEWLDDIIGPANVLLARAEAAEALAYERLEGALFAEQRADDAEIERDSANVEAALEQSNAREAWQRVSELEAQLAAQQWRPVTAEWPPYNERVIIGHGGGYGGGWYAIARRAYADVYADKVVWLMDDDTTLAFESATVAMIVPPLPDAPDVQEPTP